MGKRRSKRVSVVGELHSVLLVKGIWNAFKAESLTDMPLTDDIQMVCAHRLVADVFLSSEKLIQSSLADGKTDVLENLQQLLKFMYTGRVVVEPQKLAGLLEVAERVDFKLLADSIRKTELSPQVKAEDTVRKGRKRSHQVKDEEMDADENETPESNNDSDEDYVECQKPVSGKRPVKNKVGRPRRNHGSSTINLADKPVRKNRKEWGVAPAWLEEEAVNDSAAAAANPVSNSNSSDNKSKPAETARSYKCGHCNFASANMKQAVQHMHQAHIPDSKHNLLHEDADELEDPTTDVSYFKCQNCSESLACADAFETHQSSSHPDSPPLKTHCPLCDHRPFKDFRTYVEHLLKEHLIDQLGQPVVVECDVTSECRFASSNPAEMRRHRREPHLHKCPACDFSKIKKSEVLYHHRKVHLQIRPSVCETCGFATFTPHHLALHSRKHTGEKPHVCEVCGRAFADLSTFRRHGLRHRTDLPYRFACESCNYKTHRGDALRHHVKMVHGKSSSTSSSNRRPSVISSSPLSCPHCRFTTDRRQFLNEHVRVMHGPDAKSYACEQCEYTCKTSLQLARHKRRHSSERPFSCDDCGFAFKDLPTYKRHRQDHCKPDADKPFACPSCERKFAMLRYLKWHLKREHTAAEVSETMTADGDSVTSMPEHDWKNEEVVRGTDAQSVSIVFVEAPAEQQGDQAETELSGNVAGQQFCSVLPNDMMATDFVVEGENTELLFRVIGEDGLDEELLAVRVGEA